MCFAELMEALMASKQEWEWESQLFELRSAATSFSFFLTAVTALNSCEDLTRKLRRSNKAAAALPGDCQEVGVDVAKQRLEAPITHYSRRSGFCEMLGRTGIRSRQGSWSGALCMHSQALRRMLRLSWRRFQAQGYYCVSPLPTRLFIQSLPASQQRPERRSCCCYNGSTRSTR